MAGVGGQAVKLPELIDRYLAVHGGAESTRKGLRWKLNKALVAFGAVNPISSHARGGRALAAHHPRRSPLRDRAGTQADAPLGSHGRTRRPQPSGPRRQEPTAEAPRDSTLRDLGRRREARRRVRPALLRGRHLRRGHGPAPPRVDRARVARPRARRDHADRGCPPAADEGQAARRRD